MESGKRAVVLDEEPYDIRKTYNPKLLLTVGRADEIFKDMNPSYSFWRNNCYQFSIDLIRKLTGNKKATLPWTFNIKHFYKSLGASKVLGGVSSYTKKWKKKK